jgi:hypothetical protein
MIEGRAASAVIREFTAYRNPNSRATTRLRQKAEAKQPTPANDQYELGDFSAGRLMRGLSERSGESGRSGERGRRRTRQDQISCRALGPVKLRVVRIPAPNEEKLVSSAGPALKERASFERTLFAKYDPAV